MDGTISLLMLPYMAVSNPLLIFVKRSYNHFVYVTQFVGETRIDGYMQKAVGYYVLIS